MKGDLVSVIVPAYNSESYIGEALRSVQEQTYGEWECIVVDDGSTDGTFAKAQRFAEADDRFRILRQENLGPAAARNNGIRHSSGEYILPVDADDYIESTYLSEAHQYLSTHADCTLVGGDAELFGEQSGQISLGPFDYEDFIYGRRIIISSTMYRREDFDRVGGYDTAFRLGFEDWDFYLSLLTAESKVHSLGHVVYHYRTHKASRSATADANLQTLLRQLYNKHKEIYAPRAEDLLLLHHELNTAKQQAQYWEEAFWKTRASRAFRFGKALTAPFAALKKLFG